MKQLSFYNHDCEIQYWYREGTGDRYVLLFHGGGLDHRMFETQLPLFDETYHLVLWDARAHGLSKLQPGKKFLYEDMVDDCLRLYELHGIDQAIIMGQSMGGNLAQTIAYRYPSKVEKLVLIDCTKNTQKLTAFESFLVGLTKPITYLYPRKALVEQSAQGISKNSEVRNYIRECFEPLEKSTLVDIITEVLRCLHEDTAYRFHCPVLLLCGEDDTSGNIKKAVTSWIATDPSCTLFMISDAGHCANQDQPEVVNMHILNFLSG